MIYYYYYAHLVQGVDENDNYMHFILQSAYSYLLINILLYLPLIMLYSSQL